MISLVKFPKHRYAFLKSTPPVNFITSVILFFLFLLIFSQLIQINFAWVDDTWDLRFSRNFLTLIGTLDLRGAFLSLIEINSGRLRPVYLLWRVLVYLIAGNNAWAHYLLHFSIIAGTAIFIFKIVYFFTNSNLGSFIASSLFLVIPVNSENWVRLSPAEPISGFLLILSLYLFFRYKRVFISFSFAMLSFLSKETSAGLVPALAVYYLVKRTIGHKHNKLLKYLLLLCLGFAFCVLTTFAKRKGYSTYYEFNFADIIYRFKVYLLLFHKTFPFGVLFAGTFFARILNSLLERKSKTINNIDLIELLFLVLFIMLLLFHSPWIWVIERYMLLATIVGAVFIGMELARILGYIRGKSKSLLKLAYIIIITTYSIYLFFSLTATLGVIKKFQQTTQSIQAMMKYLSINTPRNGLVFFNYENKYRNPSYLLEKSLQLDYLYGREDIRVKYLEENDEKESDYIIVSGPGFENLPYVDESSLKLNTNISKVSRIEQRSSFVVPIRPLSLIRALIRETWFYIIKGEKISFNGMYANYLLYDWWNVYYIK